MPARISEEIRIQQINNLASIRFIRWLDIYTNNRSYAVCECLACGNEWNTRVSNILSGKACPKCSYIKRSDVRRIPQNERVKQINSIDGVTFISWLEDDYRNNYAKAIVRCAEGHEWAVSVNNLVNHGRGCPECSRASNSKISQVPSSDRIKQINSRDNISFVSWCNGYHGAFSLANVRCEIDGHEWKATVNNLVNHKKGCPRCAPGVISKIKRLNDLEIKDRIDKIDGVSFVKFIGVYKNARSRLLISCNCCSFEWSVSSGSILNSESRCPACARTGYDPQKEGTLYALRSECGSYVKIGISNRPSVRFKQLTKSTPFSFNVIEMITSKDGRIARDLESYFHRKYAGAGLNGFDGCTEWLTCSPSLLNEIREVANGNA